MEIFVLFYLFIGICIFIVGLVFGSFFNVCILRPFSNETLTNPKRSKCPACGHQLAWYDNIPLFSYIFLLAKCRYCKTHISAQYPFVELLTAVLFVCTYLKFGLTVQCLFMLIALSYFIIMSGTDFKGQVIFTQHYVPFIIIGLIAGITNGFMAGQGLMSFVDPILGLIAGAAILEIYARCGILFRIKDRVAGEGDSYIAAGIGAFLGLKFLLITIVLAVIAQVLWAIPMIIIKYARNGKYLEIFALLLFFIITASYVFINSVNGFSITWLYFTYLIVMLLLAVKVSIDLIMSTKFSVEGGLNLPFGPALFLGATMMIFFNENIIGLLKNIDWLSGLL